MATTTMGTSTGERQNPSKILYWLVGLAVIVILSIAIAMVKNRGLNARTGVPMNTTPADTNLENPDTNTMGTLPSDPSTHPDKRSTTNNPDGTIGTPTDSNKPQDIQYE